MKILYLAGGDHMDYLNDCVLIGLKEMFGADVVDFNKFHFLYDNFPPEEASRMYGKGMSTTRVIPDLNVDRTDISAKVKTQFFDLIVYGSVHRYHSHFDEVLAAYPKNKIALVDGEDWEHIHPLHSSGVPYFKREQGGNRTDLIPIAFGIPTHKVNFNTQKTKDFAHITPKDRSTYIYNTEAEYYKDYNDARFGVTTKKCGWDCMRHYEILANGCIPHFLDIADCPQRTLVNYPKELCLKVVADLKTESPDSVYDKYIEQFKPYAAQNTTLSLAAYFISCMSAIK